jgi:hypothetical protein
MQKKRKKVVKQKLISGTPFSPSSSSLYYSKGGVKTGLEKKKKKKKKEQTWNTKFQKKETQGIDENK